MSAAFHGPKSGGTVRSGVVRLWVPCTRTVLQYAALRVNSVTPSTSICTSISVAVVVVVVVVAHYSCPRFVFVSGFLSLLLISLVLLGLKVVADCPQWLDLFFHLLPKLLPIESPRVGQCLCLRLQTSRRRGSQQTWRRCFSRRNAARSSRPT